MLSDNFNCLSVCNIPRDCNSVAHELASMGMSWDPGQFCIWTDPLLECVTSLVAHDLAEQVMNERP